MKKFALVGALAVAACTPEIPHEAPQEHAIVVFDPAGSPPAVPTPNDLAIDPTTGKVNAPIDPNSSAANQEFTRDYLNTLDGFPEGTAAAAMVSGGDLDPATVKLGNVLVNDLTVAAGGGNPAVAATVQYDPSSHQIVVLPPDGAWTMGHKYEVAVLSGPGKFVQVQGGGQVYGSSVWTLARGKDPIVTCDPSDNCRISNSLITDVNQAKQLEQLRSGYEPLLNALDAQGVTRDMVASLWTFTISSMPEMRFDPANSVIPFPNNLVAKPLADGGVQVNLPYPADAMLPDGGIDPTNMQAQLIMGLNTLDGFSTTAPVVSENSEDGAALTGGAEIDPATLTDTTAGLIPLVDPSTIPPEKVATCVLPDQPTCVSTSNNMDGTYAPLPDGGTQPQQLQFIPVVPLVSHTPHGAFVTTAVKAKNGKNVAPSTAFALFRLANPLVDGSGHSTVSGVSDEQAAQIEPARQALKPFFDALEAKGMARKDLALAWNFNTQSTVSVLQQLHASVQNPALPSAVFGPITDVTTAYEQNTKFPNAAINKIYTGEILSPFLLTGTGGTFNPDPTQALVHPIKFTLVTPAGATGSVPVAIFGHGLQGNRNQALLLANTLASAGVATIAVDEVWHGDRASCTGSAAALKAKGLTSATDDWACGGPGSGPNPTAQMCDEALPIGHCVARAPSGIACTYLDPANGDPVCEAASAGICLPTADGQPGASTCAEGDFWRTPPANDATWPVGLWAPAISGWNLFNLSNLFATRDNFRQQVLDDSQLARVIAEATATGNINQQLTLASDVTLDASQLHYVGQSLGGILGTLYTAAAPEVHRSLLNVPAGDLIRIFFTSPNTDLGAMRNAFVNTLAGQGIEPGTPAFDNFLGLAKMILDPADPVNAGYATVHGEGVPSDREVLFQWIEGDGFLPNPTTEELVNATIRNPDNACATDSAPVSPCAVSFEFTEAYCATEGCALPATDSRHGFLLNGAASVTTTGQVQAATFMASGVVQTTGLP